MLLFILALVQGMDFPLIGVNKLMCGCSDFDSESQCLSFLSAGKSYPTGCEWSGTQCTSLKCSTITNSVSCNYRKDCAWNDEDVCQEFTTCNNLIYLPKSDNKICRYKDCSESNNTDSQGNFHCGDVNLGKDVCSQKTSLFTCMGSEEGASPCLWDFTKNICQSIFDCKQFTSNTTCFFQTPQCQWVNNQCQPATCQNADQFQCFLGLTFSFQYANQSTCLWQNNTCIDAQPSDLDQSNCRDLSLNTHHWSAEKEACVKCTGSSSSFMLLASIVMIFS